MRCAHSIGHRRHRSNVHYTQSRFKRILLWGLRLRRSRFKAKSTKLYLKVNSPCVTERAGARHAKPRQTRMHKKREKRFQFSSLYKATPKNMHAIFEHRRTPRLFAK